MIADQTKQNDNTQAVVANDSQHRVASIDNPILQPGSASSENSTYQGQLISQSMSQDDQKKVVYLQTGELTAIGEGSDEATKYIHWPHTAASGVTLGKGYDIGSRSPDQVIKELTDAGMDRGQAIKISKGAGLKGQAAANFVAANKQSIGVIPKSVQTVLLSRLMVVYRNKAKSAATSTRADAGNTNARGREVRAGLPAGTYVMTQDEWDNLHPALVELLTDLIYQGGYYRYDRIARINRILKDNDGDQIAQMKGVRDLLDSSYISNYAAQIGEGRSGRGSENWYGQRVDVTNKFRRTELRLAYLNYVISKLEQGYDVQFDDHEAPPKDANQPSPETKPETPPKSAPGTGAPSKDDKGAPSTSDNINAWTGSHVVEAGQMPKAIAQMYGVSMTSLRAANNDLWSQWTPTIGGFNAGEVIRVPDRPVGAPTVDFTNADLSVEFSVGRNGVNQKVDVIAVLAHLRRVGILTDEVFQKEIEVVSQQVATDEVKEELIPNTIMGITKFQKDVLKWVSYDGRIDGPDSVTLKNLKESDEASVAKILGTDKTEEPKQEELPEKIEEKKEDELDGSPQVIDFTNTELTVEFSVGKNGTNKKSDILAILAHLRRVGILSDEEYKQEQGAVMRQVGDDIIKEDLIPHTIEGITKFQREVLHWASHDGKIDGPDSTTLKNLKEADEIYVTNRIAEYKEKRAQQQAEEERWKKVRDNIPGGQLVNPSGRGMRNDAGGLGHYGAPRGNRLHRGLDLQTIDGQDIVSPIDGRAINSSWVNSRGITIPTIVIIPTAKNLGFNNLQLLYAGPVGGGWREVKAGEVIGKALNMQSLGYPPSVGPHVHVQMRMNGRWVNPEPYFGF